MAVVGTDLVMIERGGVLYKATASEIAALAGGGVPLGLWDFWREDWFGSIQAAVSSLWTGAPVLSGTNNTAILGGALEGFNKNGVFLRSGSSSNGGYRYQTSTFAADYFGVASHKFRCAFKWLTSFTGRTVRIGYLDTLSNADATDGAYFEIIDSTCSAKTASNSTRTTNATTLTLTIGVAYTFDIEVNAAGTEVRYRVYEGTNETAVLDVTNTTNIPNTNVRTFGNGIVATAGSTSADIGVLYMLGDGTIAGYNKARG